MKDGCILIVFAKAPIPGFAKTRLAEKLGMEGAANLAKRMLKETLKQAVAADVGAVELCCNPDVSHSAFQSAAERFGVALTSQGEGDLGARMHRAIERALQVYAQVLLIGSDVPRLDAACIRQARQALQKHSAVFTPAYDGGYALVGASRPIPEVFEGITWSTAEVMAQTRLRLKEVGIDHVELPAVHDIDYPEDLIHVPEEWFR